MQTQTVALNLGVKIYHRKFVFFKNIDGEFRILRIVCWEEEFQCQANDGESFRFGFVPTRFVSEREFWEKVHLHL